MFWVFGIFVFQYFYQDAHKEAQSLFCLQDILIWGHSLSVGDKATQSVRRRLDPCFSFILSLKKQQLCLTRFSSVVSYKAKASLRLARPRIGSSGQESVWVCTIYPDVPSTFWGFALRLRRSAHLIKCGYSLGWDRKTFWGSEDQRLQIITTDIIWGSWDKTLQTSRQTDLRCNCSWSKKRDTLLTQGPSKPLCVLLSYHHPHLVSQGAAAMPCETSLCFTLLLIESKPLHYAARAMGGVTLRQKKEKN